LIRLVPLPEFGPSRCRECGAVIVWALTDTDRRQPVDYEPDPQGTLELFVEHFPDGSEVDPGVQRVRRRPPGRPASSPAWAVHWATCPARQVSFVPAAVLVQVELAIGLRFGPLFARLGRWWRR
jgi:hypothetical protein